MTFNQEDPFAINLIIQSADQIVIEVSKATNKELSADWDLYIRDEYQDQFHALRRETANYLKHARGDFRTNLGVRDIVHQNVIALFLVAVNYASLYGTYTDHMRVLFMFVQILWPKVIKPP